MRKNVIILGATGSIGSNALDVVEAHPDELHVVGLTAHTSIEKLLKISVRHPDAILALTGIADKSTEVNFTGPGADIDLLRQSQADIIVNGIAGAAGLLPSLAALEIGDLALANKETIVMAGAYVRALAEKRGRAIIPVDSEHSGVFQLLRAHEKTVVEEIILTASGGPFRTWTVEALYRVKVAEALAHPTWKMGMKISIDSASMANKGLEVIEAVKMFDIKPSQVKVLIHPQSQVHALIRLQDGSLYAQISRSDMRVPLHNALFWPEIHANAFGRLDLGDCTLSFEHPDIVRFPMLSLAYAAAQAGGLYPVAYNAADEIAVAAFYNGRLGFMDIPRLTQIVMDEDWSGDDTDIQNIMINDGLARHLAEMTVKELSQC